MSEWIPLAFAGVLVLVGLLLGRRSRSKPTPEILLPAPDEQREQVERVLAPVEERALTEIRAVEEIEADSDRLARLRALSRPR